MGPGAAPKRPRRGQTSDGRRLQACALFAAMHHEHPRRSLLRLRSASGADLLAAVAAAALVAWVFAAGCGNGKVDCGPSSCTGCCDADGVCQGGFLETGCGAGGVTCLTCEAPTWCAGGTCQPPTGPGGQNPDGGTHPDGGQPDAGRAALVCARWTADRADLTEGTWSGDVAACEPGDNPHGRANALENLNLYRFLADLPPVQTDPVRDAKAQACALMMHANMQLSHGPATNWTCYTEDGAEAAGASNLSPTPGVRGVDLYMVDPGNPTTIGHRRWILAPRLGPVGLGTTSSYSCMWVTGGSGTATRPFVAFPPPGPFPLEAFSSSPFGSTVNDTGWTLQSDSIALGSAQVAVTSNGEALPVVVTQLQGGFGSSHALRFNPQGWLPQAGRSYAVSVTGVTAPFGYTVDVISCP